MILLGNFHLVPLGKNKINWKSNAQVTFKALKTLLKRFYNMILLEFLIKRRLLLEKLLNLSFYSLLQNCDFRENYMAMKLNLLKAINGLENSFVTYF